MLENAFRLQAIGVESRFRVVGHAEVLIAQRFGVEGHIAQAVAAVTISTVGMNDTFDVAFHDQFRELPGFSQANGPILFAQFRGDKRQSSLLKHLHFFGQAGSDRAAIGLGEGLPKFSMAAELEKTGAKFCGCTLIEIYWRIGSRLSRNAAVLFFGFLQQSIFEEGPQRADKANEQFYAFYDIGPSADGATEAHPGAGQGL